MGQLFGPQQVCFLDGFQDVASAEGIQIDSLVAGSLICMGLQAGGMRDMRIRRAPVRVGASYNYRKRAEMDSQGQEGGWRLQCMVEL